MSDDEKRAELVALAQAAAETLDRVKLGYRVVVLVTDEAGDFVGVGMNTTYGDAVEIMRASLVGEGLEFHECQQKVTAAEPGLVPCDRCGGFGAAYMPGTFAGLCPKCHGDGVIGKQETEKQGS
jgi:hypothetical protein